MKSFLLLWLLLLPALAAWITHGSWSDFYFHDRFLMFPLFIRLYAICAACIFGFYLSLALVQEKVRQSAWLLPAHTVFTALLLMGVVIDFHTRVPWKAMITQPLPLPGLVSYFNVVAIKFVSVQAMFIVWLLLGLRSRSQATTE